MRLEHKHQIEVVKWARNEMGLRLIHHIRNGGKRTGGQANFDLSMGELPGIPDLSLPMARSDFHGLYVEMKKEDGIVKKHQIGIHELLRKEGYKVEICYSAEEAKRCITEYLKLK